MTVDEHLTAVAAFSENAELAERVLTQFRQVLLTNPPLCTAEGMRLLDRLLEAEREDDTVGESSVWLELRR